MCATDIFLMFITSGVFATTGFLGMKIYNDRKIKTKKPSI
jgi:hypothetical protein